MDCESIDVSVLQEMNFLRDQLRSEARKSRAEDKEEFVEEAQTLLSAISEQAATLLASLRVHADETADRALLSWQKRLADGAGAADRLESRIKRVQADAHSQLQAVGKLGDAVLAELNAKLTASVNGAYCQASDLTKQLLQSTETSRAQSESIQKAAESFTAEIVSRLRETATQSRQVLTEAGTVLATIRDERASALAELRGAFAQMCERTDHARVDLAQAEEGLRSTAATVIDQIRRAGAETLAEVESARGASSRENNEQRKLLTEICANIEASARKSRAAAQRLMEQVQSAAAKSAERNEPTKSQAAAQAESEHILHRVKMAGVQVTSLVTSIQDGVQQSGRKAAALVELSQKTSVVIRELGSARTIAVQEQQTLESATTAAEQTLHLLKHHTQRVGQLVGIIRQLYGTMDARVERIRERLDTADEICRTVPREVEALSEALADSDGRSALRGTHPPALQPAKSKAKPSIPQAPKVIPRAADVKPLPFGKGTLGEIVQRNRKLNAWLHDVINEKIASSSNDQSPTGGMTRGRNVGPVDSAAAVVKNP